MARAKKSPTGLQKRTFVEELPVQLKNFEIEERREQLEQVAFKRADLAAKKAITLKTINDEDKKLEITYDQLLDVLRSKTEKQMVECVEEKNFDTNRAVVVRTDTDEIVRERALEGDERAALAQGELPVGENDPEARA